MDVVGEAIVSYSSEARRKVLIGNEGTRYELLFEIAAGGMATVYLARRRIVDQAYRQVAVKVLHPHLLAGETSQLDSFRREAQIAARLQHPNVVSVTDVGMREDGIPFLVMDYVEGESLSWLLRKLFEQKRHMPIPEAGRILLDMLAGLRAAHDLLGEDGQQELVVHRDVSPQNILVGINGTTRLADFGIAKAVSTLNLTVSGIVKGKPGYMAPEQIKGEEPDQRWDIWSAGVVAWETFATQRVFRVRDEASVLQLVLNGSVELLSDRCPWIPQPISRAVAGALMVDSESRYPTVAEFRAELLDALNATVGVPDVAQVAALANELAGDSIRERREKLRSFLADFRDADIDDDASGISTKVLQAGEASCGGSEAEVPSRSQTYEQVPSSYARPSSPDSTRVSSTLRATATPTRWTPALVYGIALVLVIVASLVLWRSRSMRGRDPDTHGRASAAVRSADADPVQPVVAKRKPQGRPLLIRANLPIVAIQVQGKVIGYSPARSSVSLSWEQLGDARSVTLIAQSGARVAIDVHGTKDAFVSFPVRESPSSTSTTSKATPRRSIVHRHESTLQLAPTPYPSGAQ